MTMEDLIARVREYIESGDELADAIAKFYQDYKDNRYSVSYYQLTGVILTLGIITNIMTDEEYHEIRMNLIYRKFD